MAEKTAKSGTDEIFSFLEKKFFQIILLLVIIFLAYLAWKAGFLYLLIGTILLGYVGWKLWVHYVQQDFISGIEWVLLEIIPPRDVLRSPKATELFITNALYHLSFKGGKEEFWQGAVWFWYSLEIVSIDGQVHFYLHAPSRLKSLIETQMYAQYPQAQVKLVDDYTLAVPEISPQSAWNGWGCEFKLVKNEAFPIKTYVDYGLDKDPKEEYKVDPISPIIEFFGSLGKGEQAWMQVVITPAGATGGPQFFRPKKYDWVEESVEVMKKMLLPYTRLQAGLEGTLAQEIRAPKFFDNVITAMNAKTSKLGFETGVRIMYVAKKEAFNMNNRRNMRLIFRQYAKPDCNEFLRFNSTQADLYGGIFTITPRMIMKMANRMLHEFRERSFFHIPMRHHVLADKFPIIWPISPFLFMGYKHHKTYVLNVEELATLWHFPGQILKVPTLERIESKEASPPPNLPT